MFVKSQDDAWLSGSQIVTSSHRHVVLQEQDGPKTHAPDLAGG
jgi:hypothetical protein